MTTASPVDPRRSRVSPTPIAALALAVLLAAAPALAAPPSPAPKKPAASPSGQPTARPPARPRPPALPTPAPAPKIAPPPRPAAPAKPATPKAPKAPKAPDAPKAPAKPSIPTGQGEIRVMVDGAPIRFDVPPQMANGTVFVPLRGVFEKMGARVQYNAATGVVKAYRKDTTVELKVGDRLSTINGNHVFMVEPAFSMNGRTLVPLRFLGEALGAQVSWNPMHRTVQIQARR